MTDDIIDGKSLIKVGDTLPQFSIVMNDGSTLKTEDLSGEPSLIMLFTTKCRDCRAELPVIQQLKDVRPDLQIVCIAREETAPDLEAYWRENGLTLPYSPQPDRKVYKLFATETVPRIYIADSDLVLVACFGDADAPDMDCLLSFFKNE